MKERLDRYLVNNNFTYSRTKAKELIKSGSIKVNDNITTKASYNVKDNVQILGGPLDGYTGIVQEINKEKNKVKVLVSMFGRETPVELEFSQVQKIN